MNIPPILEKLLLSNEAVFKNASLGLTGQNMVFVPEGKTAIILEFSIEPFFNQIAPTLADLFQYGSIADFNNAFSNIKERLCYQLQIINDNYSTYFSFHDNFSIVNTITNSIDSQADINLSFTGKREELFIYTDRSMYFNFIYPYKIMDIGADNTGLTPNYDTPINKFLPKIQQLPKTSVTFYNNTTIDFLAYATINTTASDAYFPVNYQTLTTNYPQMEYLRFFNISNETSIQQPLTTGLTLQFEDLFKLPLINVKYALLNKKASDYGLTQPKF